MTDSSPSGILQVFCTTDTYNHTLLYSGDNYLRFSRSRDSLQLTTEADLDALLNILISGPGDYTIEDLGRELGVLKTQGDSKSRLRPHKAFELSEGKAYYLGDLKLVFYGVESEFFASWKREEEERTSLLRKKDLEHEEGLLKNGGGPDAMVLEEKEEGDDDPWLRALEADTLMKKRAAMGSDKMEEEKSSTKENEEPNAEGAAANESQKNVKEEEEEEKKNPIFGFLKVDETKKMQSFDPEQRKAWEAEEAKKKKDVEDRKRKREEKERKEEELKKKVKTEDHSSARKNLDFLKGKKSKELGDDNRDEGKGSKDKESDDEPKFTFLKDNYAGANNNSNNSNGNESKSYGNIFKTKPKVIETQKQNKDSESEAAKFILNDAPPKVLKQKNADPQSGKSHKQPKTRPSDQDGSDGGGSVRNNVFLKDNEENPELQEEVEKMNQSGESEGEKSNKAEKSLAEQLAEQQKLNKKKRPPPKNQKSSNNNNSKSKNPSSNNNTTPNNQNKANANSSKQTSNNNNNSKPATNPNNTNNKPGNNANANPNKSAPNPTNKPTPNPNSHSKPPTSNSKPSNTNTNVPVKQPPPQPVTKPPPKNSSSREESDAENSASHKSGEEKEKTPPNKSRYSSVSGASSQPSKKVRRPPTSMTPVSPKNKKKRPPSKSRSKPKPLRPATSNDSVAAVKKHHGNDNYLVLKRDEHGKFLPRDGSTSKPRPKKPKPSVPKDSNKEGGTPAPKKKSRPKPKPKAPVQNSNNNNNPKSSDSEEGGNGNGGGSRKSRRILHRVLCSGFSYSEEYMRQLRNMGVLFIIDKERLFDILIMHKFKRTIKFLLALTKGIPIVKSQWLEDSVEHQTLLDFNDYLFSDKQSEKQYGYSLQASLMKRKQGGPGFLKGVKLWMPTYIKPSFKEVKMLITQSGGELLPDIYKGKNANYFNLMNEKNDEASFYMDGGYVIHSIELLYVGILKQELDEPQKHVFT